MAVRSLGQFLKLTRAFKVRGILYFFKDRFHQLGIENREKDLFASEDLSCLNKIELSNWMKAGSGKAFFKATCYKIVRFEYYSKDENTVILDKSLNPQGSMQVPM